MLALYETLRLADDEDIQYVSRQHPWYEGIRSVPSIAVLFILFLFMFPFFYQGPLGVLIFFIILALDAYFLCRGFLRWRGSLFIMTNRRLILVGRKGVFRKEVREIQLAKIIDISYQKKGIVQNLMNCGIVSIRYQGVEEPLVIERVHRPGRFLDTLSRLIEHII